MPARWGLPSRERHNGSHRLEPFDALDGASHPGVPHVVAQCRPAVSRTPHKMPSASRLSHRRSTQVSVRRPTRSPPASRTARRCGTTPGSSAADAFHNTRQCSHHMQMARSYSSARQTHAEPPAATAAAKRCAARLLAARLRACPACDSPTGTCFAWFAARAHSQILRMRSRRRTRAAAERVRPRGGGG